MESTLFELNERKHAYRNALREACSIGRGRTDLSTHARPRHASAGSRRCAVPLAAPLHPLLTPPPPDPNPTLARAHTMSTHSNHARPPSRGCPPHASCSPAAAAACIHRRHRDARCGPCALHSDLDARAAVQGLQRQAGEPMAIPGAQLVQCMQRCSTAFPALPLAPLCLYPVAGSQSPICNRNCMGTRAWPAKTFPKSAVQRLNGEQPLGPSVLAQCMHGPIAPVRGCLLRPCIHACAHSKGGEGCAAVRPAGRSRAARP